MAPDPVPRSTAVSARPAASACGPHAVELVEGEAGHDLGLGAGDEHPAVDEQVEACGSPSGRATYWSGSPVEAPLDHARRSSATPRSVAGSSRPSTYSAPSLPEARSTIRRASMPAEPGSATPAAVSRRSASAASIAPGDRAGGQVGPGHPIRGRRRRAAAPLVGDERVDHLVELAGQHLVELVDREPDAVVGDPVLLEVVGADLLGAATAADLGLAGIGRLGRLLVLLELAAGGPAAPAWPWPGSGSGSSRPASPRPRPVGLWVMRTAESVVLTDCPPGPDER